MGELSKYDNKEYKTWRFRLISSLGDILLEVNPVGWNELELVLERNKFYGGVFRTYSAELEYVFNGYDTLKSLMNTEGILSECQLKVNKRDAISQIDTEVFSSKIDFTQYTESTANKRGIKVPLVDDTFLEKLKNREDIDVPYDRAGDLDGNTEDLDGNAITAGVYTDVEILGREFGSEAVGDVYQEVGEGDPSNIYNLQQGVPNYYIGIPSVVFPHIELLPNFQNVTKSVSASGFNERGPEACFYYTGNTIATVEINIQYAISGDGYSSFLKFYKILYNQDGTIDSWTIEESIDTYANVDGIISKQYDLPKYTGLHLYFSRPTLGTGTTLLVRNGFKINIRDVSSFEPTNCKVVLPHEVFDHMATVLTGETGSFRSKYFGRIDLGYDKDGEGAYIATTKGLLLRGFPIGYIEEEPEDQELSERVSQLSYRWKELFESYYKIKNVSMQVVLENGKYIIEIEKTDDLYSRNVSRTITSSEIEEKTFERILDIKMFVSEIVVGYNAQPNDLLGGLEEYINKETYSTDLSKVAENKLELISAYSAASVGIEQTRRRPSGATSTEETIYDNQIFFIELWNDEIEGIIQRDEQGFSEVNGLEGLDTKINLGLTPKQMLLAHSDKINIGLAKYPTSLVKYNTSDKTTDLSFKYEGSNKLIVENGSETASSLGVPRFTGFRLVFSAPIGFTEFISLRENINELIGVESELDNEDVFGWGENISTDPVNKPTNWELLEANPPTIGTVKVLVTGDGAAIVTDKDQGINIS